MINKIIKLEDNKEYLIIDEIHYKNKLYLVSKKLINKIVEEQNITLLELSDNEVKIIEDINLVDEIIKYKIELNK